MATTVNTSNVTQKASQEATREECIASLSKGRSIHELPDVCREMLGANSKTGILARRSSAIGRIWSPSEGHNSRSYSETTFGAPIDNSSESDSMSTGEIFLQNKSPEHVEKIKKTIARTASRGAKVRTDDIITPEEVETHQKEEELQRRASREKQQQTVH